MKTTKEQATARRPVKTRKAGAAKKEVGKNGRQMRNGYEKGVWFISKTIKWLTPSKGLTWCEKYKVLPSTVVI